MNDKELDGEELMLLSFAERKKVWDLIREFRLMSSESTLEEITECCKPVIERFKKAYPKLTSEEIKAVLKIAIGKSRPLKEKGFGFFTIFSIYLHRYVIDNDIARELCTR